MNTAGGTVNSFTLSRFVFQIKALDALQLPSYKGSTLRGAFGHAFKRVVCTLHKNICDDCLLKQKCVYSYIFETPPPEDSGMMKKYPAAPHPFILLPPLERKRLYKPGETFCFELTLIGRATEYLPYFIYTFNELGESGMGKGRGTFALAQVRRAETEEVIYNSDGKILPAAYKKTSWEELLAISHDRATMSHELTLCFITPTRIKYGEDLVVDLEFHMLIRNLLRRISTLSYFHCGAGLDIDFRDVIKKAENITTVNRSLVWYDWERYSNRQDTRMKLGGFTGEVMFQGDLAPFLPYLLLGEQIHVGKGTSFGLGKYKLES